MCFYLLIIFFLRNKKYNFIILFYFFFFFLLFTIKGIYTTRECLRFNHFGLIRLDYYSIRLIWISFWITFTSTLLYNNLYKNFFLFIIIFLCIFTTYNILFFFFIFEITLFPIFYLFFFIRTYKERYLSLIYFFIYTSFSRLPFIIRIFFLFRYGIDNYVFFIIKNLITNYLYIIRFLLRFITKIPVWGLHFWLPKAHVDAPTGRSIILARILLKLRRYRILRLTIRFYNIYRINYHIIILRCVGFFYSSNICLRLIDYKVIVAYSSVSHISLAFARLISICFLSSYQRGYFLLIRHRITSPALFFFSEIFMKYKNTRSIIFIKRLYQIKGLIYFFIIFIFINLAIPPFINFWRELFIILNIIIMSLLRILLFFFRFLSNRLFSVYIIRSLTHSKNFKTISIKYNLIYWLINTIMLVSLLYITIFFL